MGIVLEEIKLKGERFGPPDCLNISGEIQGNQGVAARSPVDWANRVAVSLISDCVAKRNPHLRDLKLKGGGAERTITLYWRRSSVRKDLMRELVDDLSREHGK